MEIIDKIIKERNQSVCEGVDRPNTLTLGQTVHSELLDEIKSCNVNATGPRHILLGMEINVLYGPGQENIIEVSHK